MAKRKKFEDHNGTSTAEAESPAEESGHDDHSETPPPKKGPAVSFRCPVDRSTSLEVAVWNNPIVYDGREVVQYSTTLKRSWKDQEGTWHTGGSHRAHELPILQFLLDKAHQFCLNARTEDSSIPF